MRGCWANASLPAFITSLSIEPDRIDGAIEVAPTRPRSFAAHAARFKIDQSGRADIKRKPPPPEITGAPAHMTVRLKHDGTQTLRLQTRRRRHARYTSTDNRHVFHRSHPIDLVMVVKFITF